MAKNCVCDSGREWCCAGKRASGRMVLGGWAGVSDSGAVDYCKSRWPKLGLSQWSTCAGIVKSGQDPAGYMATQSPSGGGSLISDFFGGLSKVVTGGVTGAAQGQAQVNQQVMLQQQQAQKAKQMQMLVIAGVVGLGAFMLLRKRD